MAAVDFCRTKSIGCGETLNGKSLFSFHFSAFLSCAALSLAAIQAGSWCCSGWVCSAVRGSCGPSSALIAAL